MGTAEEFDRPTRDDVQEDRLKALEADRLRRIEAMTLRAQRPMSPEGHTQAELRDAQTRILSDEIESLRLEVAANHKATSTGWRFDKTVPVGLIAAMAIQFIGGVWFMSKLDSRVGYLEVRTLEQAARDEKQDSVLGSAVAGINRQLERIDSNILTLIRESKK